MKYKQKYILDTSILFENISQDTNVVLDRLNSNNINRRYHLNHSLIEFRLGLLHNWIGFYLDVLATQDVKGAKRRLAKVINYKPRQGSTHMLLEALLSQVFTSLEVGNVGLYLVQIEECINYAQTSLDLLSLKIKGSNADHHLLKPRFINVDDYDDFNRRCKADYVVDLATLFTVRGGRFRELVAHLKQLSLSGQNAKRVSTMIVLIEQGLNMTQKVNSKLRNRRYGDIVIAMDTPSGYHVLSSDTSFKFLCDGLGKTFIDYNQLS